MTARYLNNGLYITSTDSKEARPANRKEPTVLLPGKASVIVNLACQLDQH